MEVKNLKELQKVIQLCQKTGVTTIKIDNIEMAISPVYKEKKIKSYLTEVFPEADIKVPQFQPMPVQAVADKIATSELTEEELMFYSAVPETERQG